MSDTMPESDPQSEPTTTLARQRVAIRARWNRLVNTPEAVSVLFDVTGSMRNVPRILQANLPRLLSWMSTLHTNVARYMVLYLAGPLGFDETTVGLLYALLLVGDFAPSLLSPFTGLVSDRFDRLVRVTGMPPIRLHDLRHTAASLYKRAATYWRASLMHHSHPEDPRTRSVTPAQVLAGWAYGAIAMAGAARLVGGAGW